MWFSSLIRNAKPSGLGQRRRIPTAPRQRSTFRPQLEALEDRWMPSTLHVTSLGDSDKGSLRDEIAHASSSGKDTIVFDVRGTINLYSQLNINSGVAIQGPGANLLTLTTNYNFGDPWGQSTRVFEVNAKLPVVISGLTITDNGENGDGAAVLNYSTLTISGCNISNNLSGSYGGGIANFGTLTLNGCTLSYDSASKGGGIYNTGTMTVSACTLSSDSQLAYGPGSAIYNVGTLTVSTSTFVGDNIYGPYTDGGGNTFI